MSSWDADTENDPGQSVTYSKLLLLGGRRAESIIDRTSIRRPLGSQGSQKTSRTTTHPPIMVRLRALLSGHVDAHLGI